MKYGPRNTLTSYILIKCILYETAIWEGSRMDTYRVRIYMDSNGVTKEQT